MKGSMEYMSENKRYEYWEDSDTAYDTKIKYGQYFRIIDKKDMVCLLNEQDKIIKDKESLIKAKNQQLDDVKKVLHKYEDCDHDLIESILDELGWD